MMYYSFGVLSFQRKMIVSELSTKQLKPMRFIKPLLVKGVPWCINDKSARIWYIYELK